MAAMHHPYDPADVRSREYNMHSLHGHMISVASYNALLEVRGRDKPGPRWSSHAPLQCHMDYVPGY